MPYDKIGPREINVLSVKERKSKSEIKAITIDPDTPPAPDKEIKELVMPIAEKILSAKANNASIMMAYGAHLVKNGASHIVVRLMEKGWITHVSTQGAGSIHDWELAYFGRTEEDVRANVKTGTFGTWEETGKYISLAVQAGAIQNMGYGQSLGKLIQEDTLDLPTIEELEADLRKAIDNNDELLPAKAELYNTLKTFKMSGGKESVLHPNKAFSIFGNAYRLNVPVTVHPGIGYDIIYNNPFANGAALGRGSHLDYGSFVHSVKNLSNGVFLSIGSAIMAPQVFEKAVSFANNILLREGKIVQNHEIIINDLQASVWDWSQGEPPKSSPDYYLRFLKSFYRMGGRVTYASLDNRLLLHHLYHTLLEMS